MKMRLNKEKWEHFSDLNDFSEGEMYTLSKWFDALKQRNALDKVKREQKLSSSSEIDISESEKQEQGHVQAGNTKNWSFFR